MPPEQSDHVLLPSSPIQGQQSSLSAHNLAEHSPFSTASDTCQPVSQLDSNQSPTILSTTAEHSPNQLTISSFYPKHLLDLNLTYCPVNKYYDLLEDPDNPYDLVEGILIFREMVLADYLHH